MHGVAWGVTNTGVDVQDVYIINATADGTHFTTAGEGDTWRRQRSTDAAGLDDGANGVGLDDGANGVAKFEVRSELIVIKHRATRTIEVRTVVGVGPVISDNGILDDGGAIAPEGLCHDLPARACAKAPRFCRGGMLVCCSCFPLQRRPTASDHGGCSMAPDGSPSLILIVAILRRRSYDFTCLMAHLVAFWPKRACWSKF
jgi:hypothetical protein